MDDAEALTVVLIIVVATILFFLLLLIMLVLCRLKVESPQQARTGGSMISAMAAVLAERTRQSFQRQRPPSYDEAVATVSTWQQHQAPPAYTEAIKAQQGSPEEPPPYCTEEEEQHI